MPRSQGFARGDLDTSFPLDDKFLALRATVDAVTYYAAAGVYFHVVAATWREAERKPASRIAPDAVDLIAHLVRVGLFDVDECVQRRAYAHSVARATRARRTAAERKQRNRAGMSRVTPRDSLVGLAVSTDIQSSTDQSSTDQIRSVQHPRASDDILDGPVAYFEATGRYPAPGSELHRWVTRLAAEYGAPTFQEALASEQIVSPVLKDLLGRTEARLAKEADQARKRRAQNGTVKPKRTRTPEQEAIYRATLKAASEGIVS